ncbi:helix-turn-helix domain-containing protein [Chryseobacterium sp. MIQD13]|uniref:helix-turn-helix domain-containing protein n=1 Tax=Chryseobacterium sp. MIQD13 TaxID=3422310 RepID=UPI003D26EB42
MSTQPNYKKIYEEIVARKYPKKEKQCRPFFAKEKFSALDVLKLDEIIFGYKNNETEVFNQKHRSYDRVSILKILDYQKNNKLNNTQLAQHFSLSRNTVAKWKKMLSIQADK